MSDDIASLVIEVKSEGVDKAKKSLADLSNQGQKTERSLGNVSSGAKSADSALAGMAGSVKSLIGAYAGLAGVIGFSKISDEYTKFNAQLKIATGTQREFSQALKDVNAIATSTQSSISSISTLYARLNASLKDVGVSQESVAKITETVGLSLKVAGASAAESSSAMLQLSQAFSSGVLRGEEFNAMMESAPSLMRALAESIGVPVGKLRELAAEGKITSDVLTKAFADDSLLEKFRGQAREVETISGNLEVLQNTVVNIAGTFSKKTGIVDLFTTAIKDLNSTLMVLAGISKLDFKLEKFLPEYQKFSQKMKSESLPKNNGGSLGSILPQGARIDGVLPRIDIGNIGDADVAYTKLKATLDAFVKANPLKDDIEKQKEYAKNLSIINELESKGLLSIQEAGRYRAQLNDEITKGNKSKNDVLSKQRDEALKSIQDSINEEQDRLQSKFEFEKMWQEKLDKQKADAYKKQLEYVNSLEKIANENFANAQKEYIEAEKERVRAFEKSAAEIKSIFLKGFSDMIRGGKGSWKTFTKELVVNFKTAVADAIYKMFAQPFVVKILASLTGLTASGAAGAVDILGTNGIAGGSIFSTISEGLSSLNTNVVGSIEKLGAFLSNGNGGLADRIGGALGQYSTQIASALTFAPAVLSLLKGDIKSAAFQGAGAGIGLALGGPVGGAIGSFIGGAVGGLFGKSKAKRPVYIGSASSTYDGRDLSTTFGDLSGQPKHVKSLGANANLESVNKAFSQSLGALLGGFGESQKITTSIRLWKRKAALGWFDASFGDGSNISLFSDLGRGDASAAFQVFFNRVLGEGIVTAIQRTKLPDGIKSLFSGLSDPAQVTNMINASLALNQAQSELANRFGLTVDQAGRVSKSTGLAGDELAKFATTLAQSASAFKTVGDVLVEAKAQLSEGLGGNVPASLKDFDNVLKGIDKTTQSGIDSFLAMFSLREQFVAFTSSLNQLKGGVNTALLGIVSDSEKQAMLNADLATVFAELGRDVPGSVEELIALGKSIDFTTKEGIDLAAVFPSLVTAFVNTKGAVDDLMNSLRDVENFKTIVDFNRYKGLAQNYGTQFANKYIDGQQVAYGSSNNTSVSLPQVTASNNTTISTSDPNLLQAIQTLSAKVDALQLEASKTAIQSKRAADVLVNVSPNGNAIQTEAVV